MRYLAGFRLSVVVTGCLALIAAAAGLVYPGMYAPVVPEEVAVGVLTQDLVVALGSLLMTGLVVGMRGSDVRSAIVVVGILGFLFYAYGIYAIEQVYTPLYVLYLAVWAASCYTLALGLAGLEYAAIDVAALPAAMRVSAAAYGIAIAGMFNVLWIGRLIPLIRAADRIEYLFSVYVIDLVFVMPAFVIAAVLALRKRPLGVAVLPALFVVGVGILSPLALAELLKGPRYGLPMDAGGLALFGALAASFLLFAVAYLAVLRIEAKGRGTGRRGGGGARVRSATGAGRPGRRVDRAEGRSLRPGRARDGKLRSAASPHHTVTAFHELHGFPTRVPDGVGPFSSPVVPVGQTWEYTFEQAGVYDLICMPHMLFGMVIRVVAGEASGPGAQPIPVAQMPDEVRTAAGVLAAPALAPDAIVEAGSVSWHDVGDGHKVLPPFLQNVQVPAGE